MSDFAEALGRRAEALGLTIPAPLYLPLEAYFRLLARWNRTVNLTALPVDDLAPEALDRLVLEPLAAAPHLPDRCRHWIDLGSGGGSPAIPLKLICPSINLIMVEARSRKVAFLREAIRELGLNGVRADAIRFEAISGAASWARTADLVTARAVRLDRAFLSTVDHVLRPAGVMALFTAESAPTEAGPLAFDRLYPLLAGQKSALSLYNKKS